MGNSCGCGRSSEGSRQRYGAICDGMGSANHRDPFCDRVQHLHGVFFDKGCSKVRHQGLHSEVPPLTTFIIFSFGVILKNFDFL